MHLPPGCIDLSHIHLVRPRQVDGADRSAARRFVINLRNTTELYSIIQVKMFDR